MNGFFPELNIELTMEQQFQLRLMEEQIPTMSTQQAKELLLQAAKLILMKDCVIKSLIGAKMEG